MTSGAAAPKRGTTTIVGSVAGSGLGAALVLALLAGAGAFAATAAPRENAQAQSSALHTELAAAGPGAFALFGRSDLGSLRQSLYPAAPDRLVSTYQIGVPEAVLTDELASLGVPLSTDQADYWQGLGTNEYKVGFPAATPAQAALPQVRTSLNYRTNLTDHAVLVRGVVPDRASSPAGAGRPGFFQVAITEQTAATFHLDVGATMTLASTAATPIQLRVTGILKIRDPADEFWTYDVTAAAPQLIVPPKGAPPHYASDLFVGDNEVEALEETFGGGSMPLEYALPLDLAHLTSDQAQPLANAIVTATAYAADIPLPSGTPGVPATLSVDLAGGPVGPLRQFAKQRQAVDAVLSIVVGSLAALGAAVLLLCILLLAERRSAEFTLLRARGASGRQLALLAVRAGAISVIPAAAGMVLGGVLVPSPRPMFADWWMPALIALVVVAGPGVAAIRYRARAVKSTDRASAAAVGVRTARTGARRERIRRAVASAAAVVLCVGAVAVLRYYGSGSNLLAALAPFLIAVPIAIGMYYLTPPVVRALTHAAARRRDAVPFIAMARASRGSTIAWLPSLALVLTLAVVAVGSMVHDTIVSGEVDGSWAAVGADDVITDPGSSSAGFSPAAVHAITALPGVARSAAAGVLDIGDGHFALTAVAGPLPADTTVVIVDPARYSALTAGTPATQLPAGLAEPADPHAPVPVLVSPQLAVDVPSSASMVIDGVRFPIRQAGVATATAALPGAGDFVILPSWALGRYGIAAPAPSVLLLDGDIDAATLIATLHRVAPAASVTQRATELSALTHAPFQADTFDTLDLSMLAAALLAVVALLSGLIMGARSREQALARLATMGLSRRQANRLVLLENLPALAAAVIGGVVCTVAIGALIGPGIDLGVFTGTAQSVPLRVDPWALALAGAAIAVTAAATLAGHTAAAHRRGVTAALRLGNGE